MSALPKFNFKAVDLTDEQLNEQIDAASTGQGEGKFFRPGLHQLEIKSSKYTGQASDDTWAKWVVKYTGAGGKETSDMLMVPSSKLTYLDKKGKENAFAIAKLKNFLESLGAEFKVKSLGDTLSVYFGKEDALVGQNVGAQIGYAGTHVAYLGKGEGGAKRYGLAYRSGDAVEKTPEFQSYDEAYKYTEQNGIEVKRFCDVLRYEVAASGNKKPDSNW